MAVAGICKTLLHYDVQQPHGYVHPVNGKGKGILLWLDSKRLPERLEQRKTLLRRDARISQRTMMRGLRAAATPHINPGKIEHDLWREFFSDPSQWWDHRPEKENAGHPDFKHKTTQAALWLDGKSTPSWVERELAAMVPGALQMSIFSWNKRLAKHVKAREYEKAIALFQQLQRQGVSPDKFTFVRVLNACASLQDLERGRCIHLQTKRTGHESDLYVGGCLVDMYAKCGSIDDAREVFDRMSTHNVISWNAIILGTVKCGEPCKAWMLFQQMESEDVEPNVMTFVGVLNACASSASLQEGRYLHDQIIRRGWESHKLLGNSLIDMYAKCGSINDALKTFEKMATRDQVSWNAMITGYVKCGKGRKALELYQRMQEEGLDSNSITLVGLLKACASLAALEEGQRIHDEIIEKGLESDVVIGNSLIDMYAKCGSIKDAQLMFNKMPIRTVVSWTAMLTGYAIHGHAKEALEHFMQMCQAGVEVNDVTFLNLLSACSHGGLVDDGLHYFESMSPVYGYVLLSNIYAAAGEWDSSENVHQQRLRKGEKKILGLTWLEVNNQVHSFRADGQKHPEIVKIRAELKRLSGLMKVAGYIPDSTYALHNVKQGSKELHLCNHSEKLAIAYGLISTPARTPLRISQNLCLCGDCHTASKFITKATGRKILVRDATCFHHFQDGVCSCNGYW